MGEGGGCVRESILVILFALAVMVITVSACSRPTPAQLGVGTQGGTPESQAQQQAKVQDYATQTTTAMQSGNVATCASIQDERFKQSCIDNVLLKKATDTSDDALCQQISAASMKQSCLDTILIKKAIASKNKSYCDAIKDLNSKTLCLNMVTG